MDPLEQLKNQLKNLNLHALAPGPTNLPHLSLPAPPRNPLIENMEANTAEEFHTRLMAYVTEFDNALDQAHEVGMRLVSFGQSITFQVTRIGFWNPSLIEFSGNLDDGTPVQLIQHITQISFLLMALKRPDPSQPKRKIGFSRHPDLLPDGGNS